MKLFDSIKSFFAQKPARNGSTAYVYVYSSGRDASAEINPNDQIAILRRLSSFVAKKNSPVTIIFPGVPSKKIPDGAKQDGVQARFATSDQLANVVKLSVAEFRKTHSVVLAADRSEFQKLSEKLKVRYSLASTFTKTLESVCGPLQRDSKPQPQRRQPQSPKKEPKTVDSTPATMPSPEPVAIATPDETPLLENAESEPQSDPPETEGTQTVTESPSSKIPPNSRPKLHRHVPSQKRELTDRAILDLIDPL